MNALELRGLTKQYKDFTLGPLDLTLPGGCVMGLVGENGAGKSTTIKLILDLIRADGGTVTVLGQDGGTRQNLDREEIGTVLDEVGITGCLNAVQVGKVMRGIFTRWDDAAYERFLNRLSVPKDKPFAQLSRGTKMKLGIAVALSHQPRLLLLDEATSGLDPVVRDEVIDMLYDFTRDETHAILISSHIVSDLEKLCDYIAFLHRGQLLLCQEKDRLCEQYGVVSCQDGVRERIPARAVLGEKRSPYGTQILVRRSEVPEDIPVSPVDIEQLFILMTKEE